MANPNLFAQYLQPPKSVLDYTNEMDAADARRNQNALVSLALRQKVDADTRATNAQNALQRIASMWSGQTPPEQKINDLRNSGIPELMTQADSLEKGYLERQKTGAQVAKDTADAGSTTFKTQQAKQSAAIQQMASLASPQDAASALNLAVQRGEVPMQVATLLQKTIPQVIGPEFDQWKLRMIVGISDPAKMAELLKPHLQTNNVGGQTVTQAFDPITGAGRTVSTIQNTQSPDNAATVAQQERNSLRVDARARDLNAITREGQQSQVVTDPVRGTMIVNKATGLMRPALGLNGKPVAAESTAKRTADSTRALPIIEEARNLIDQSTGSYVGRGIDYAGRAVGMATPGDQASAKLKVLQANLMLAQPRMEGPQSDKDVQLYREAAGQIGDATVPAEIKKAALATIEQIHRKYAGQDATPAAQAPTAGGFRILGVN